MRRQKDVDARWTKKINETHYGYKNHINADQDHKLVQSYPVTDAAVHGSQVFEELLDQAMAEHGKKRAASADSAYRSQEKGDPLATDNIPSQICEKGRRAHPDRGTENSQQRKIQSSCTCRTGLRCASADGRTYCAHHWPSARRGQDRPDESGI